MTRLQSIKFSQSGVPGQTSNVKVVNACYWWCRCSDGLKLNEVNFGILKCVPDCLCIPDF